MLKNHESIGVLNCLMPSSAFFILAYFHCWSKCYEYCIKLTSIYQSLLLYVFVLRAIKALCFVLKTRHQCFQLVCYHLNLKYLKVIRCIRILVLGVLNQVIKDLLEEWLCSLSWHLLIIFLITILSSCYAWWSILKFSFKTFQPYQISLKLM